MENLENNQGRMKLKGKRVIVRIKTELLSQLQYLLTLAITLTQYLLWALYPGFFPRPSVVWTAKGLGESKIL